MSTTQIDPRVHRVQETPVAHLFRRRLRCPDILTFFHVETGEWILARWMHRPTHLVEEIEDLGGRFERLTPELVQRIVLCWGPVDWQAKRRLLLAKHRDRERRNMDEALKRRDEYAWLKKRTKDIVPVPYAIQVPVPVR